MRRFPVDLRPLAAVTAKIFGVAWAFNSASAATIWPVSTCEDQVSARNCADASDGSLRRAYGCAQDGDTIDLTQLKCSKITLTGQLLGMGGPENITINGPGKDALTIDAAYRSRAFVHSGFGLITINDLSIIGGSYTGARTAQFDAGGCIYSAGSISLANSIISQCTIRSSGEARGGAVYARGIVTLENSVISYSAALGEGNSFGGAVFSDAATLKRTFIYDNYAGSFSQINSQGGGLFLTGHTQPVSDVSYSAIFANRAGLGAGISSPTIYSSATLQNRSVSGIGTLALKIKNSTIARNYANGTVGGIYAPNVRVYNSTIAANAANGGSGVGVSVQNSLFLFSSIVAKNTFRDSSGHSIEGDVDGFPGIIVSGSNNIVMASALELPRMTLPDNPLLLSCGRILQGRTAICPLSQLSPAREKGVPESAALKFDQRGIGFPRRVGVNVDIGAVEFNDDHIFTSGLDPDDP